MQINEVDIRMRVGAGSAAKDWGEPEGAPGTDAERDREEIIQEAVRRTLKLLRSSRER